MLGLVLRRLTQRCNRQYDAYPQVRCVRRYGHDGPHRSPFGMEW